MKINQLKAGVVLSYLQTGLNAIISLVYTPIMLRLLGQSEYGIYTLASSMISYLGLLNFGLSSSYIRYYSKYKSNNDKLGLAQLNGVFLTVYIIIALIAFICGLIISFNVDILFSQKLTVNELHTTMLLMIILSFNLMMTFISTVFTAYISANEQFAFQKLLSMGKTVLSPLITIPVLLMGYRSIGLAVTTTIVSLIVDFSNIIFCFKKLNIQFCLKGANYRMIGEIASYSIFIAVNSIVDLINWQVDKFILGRYHGAIATAIYGVASQLNSLYMSISTSISSVFTPRIHRLMYVDDRDKEFTKLFIKIGRIQMFILGLVASGLILFGQTFINFWAGSDYKEAYVITLLLVLPATIPLIQNLGIEIQRAKNKHQFRSLVYAIMAILNVFISIPLGKYYGGVGCALGTAISMILANGFLINWYYAKHLSLGIKEFWIQILNILPAILLSGIFGLFIKSVIYLNTLFSFGICVIIYSIIYLIICWKIAMNKSEKDLIIKLYKKILAFV